MDLNYACHGQQNDGPIFNIFCVPWKACGEWPRTIYCSFSEVFWEIMKRIQAVMQGLYDRGLCPFASAINPCSFQNLFLSSFTLYIKQVV